MSDPGKISPTAWLVAKVRSEYTEIPYCKEIENIIPQEMRTFSMGILFRIIRWVAKNKPAKFETLTTAEGRYLNINDALPKNNKYVLLELASGLSPRSIEKSKEGVTVIETDLPKLINLKEQVIENIYKDDKRPDHHHLLTINVMNREELQTVRKLYQKIGNNKPLYIVHEGLLPYFSDEEKIQFRDNMQWFLKKIAPQKGYWITTDFTPYPKKKEQKSAVVQFMTKIVEKITKRKANWTDSHENIALFLKEGGFKCTRLVNSNLEKKMSIHKKIDLPFESIIALNKEYSAYLIELQ